MFDVVIPSLLTFFSLTKAAVSSARLYWEKHAWLFRSEKFLIATAVSSGSQR